MIGLKYLYAMLAGAFGGSAPLAPARRGRRPTGIELRNPADPFQAARIEAAVAKRARRQCTLQTHAMLSRKSNSAHHRSGCDSSLNPFYIAR